METVLAAPEESRLAEASVDLAFFCNVVHHIRHWGAYFRRLGRVLRAGGWVAVSDFQYFLVFER